MSRTSLSFPLGGGERRLLFVFVIMIAISSCNANMEKGVGPWTLELAAEKEQLPGRLRGRQIGDSIAAGLKHAGLQQATAFQGYGITSISCGARVI